MYSIIKKTKKLLNTNKIIKDINSVKQVNKLIKLITVNVNVSTCVVVLKHASTCLVVLKHLDEEEASTVKIHIATFQTDLILGP